MNSKLNYGGFNLSSYVLETVNLKKDFKKITAVESLNLKLKKRKDICSCWTEWCWKNNCYGVNVKYFKPYFWKSENI